jgi:hypothetical protein
MGDIIVHGINDLKHANGATDQVNISVFVWAEDVALSIPTSAEPGSLSPQAGDEYGDGAVSRPMGILARTAGMLTSVPGIGAYAKAAQMGASAMANVAQLFGYARPNDISDIKPLRPAYMGNMANTMIPDSATKLTLDPKQELTVDPKTMGLGSDDEMTVKSIAMRESYYVKFNWPTAAATEDLLWTSRVTPVVWDELSINGQTEYHFPATCFATLPFAKWRGTMKFRFQIVASAYHKGRLKIVYDPYLQVTNEYNTNFTHIVDLAKQRDFSVDIGWGQPQSFCKTDSPVDSPLPYSTSGPFGTPSTANNDFNGYISVYVVNELTTPNSDVNNDIEVNVYVAMCDDFEVVEPTSLLTASLSVFPDAEAAAAQAAAPLEQQMGTESRQGEDLTQPDGDRNLDEDKPQSIPVQETLAPKLSPTDYTMDVFYGDPITSFRQVLKRYNFYGTYGPDSAGSQIVNVTQNNFPLYRGYAADGFYNAVSPTDPTPYNYFTNTLLNYITPAFGARRGGIRWKINGQDTSRRNLEIVVRRLPSGTGTQAITRSPYEQLNGFSQNQRANMSTQAMTAGLDGLHASASQQNPVLEYEVPFYDTFRFYPAKRIEEFETTPDNLYALHEIQYMVQSIGSAITNITTYVSTGEDFMLAFYLGPPVYYSYANPSPSSIDPT